MVLNFEKVSLYVCVCVGGGRDEDGDGKGLFYIFCMAVSQLFFKYYTRMKIGFCDKVDCENWHFPRAK